MNNSSVTRRNFLATVPTMLLAPYATSAANRSLPLGQPELTLRITNMDIVVVRATRRTNWIFVQ